MSAKIETKWNTQDLEIKTKSVERQLQPLVIQVTTLVNTTDTTKKRKGKSKNAAALISAVERATSAFIEKGEEIAHENPEIEKEMLSAVEDIRQTGGELFSTARVFSTDPCSSDKRKAMVLAARKLLSAVTRLLILADMVDVRLLLHSINLVKADLERLGKTPNKDLARNVAALQQNTNDLINKVGLRQRELQDPQARDDLAAARAQLKKFSIMLMSASKAYLNHPNVPAAKNNQDYVIKQMCEAIDTINDVAQGKTPKNGSRNYEDFNNLAVNLNQLDDLLQVEPLSYNKVRSRSMLEKQLDGITSSAILFSQADSIDQKRRERIVAGCDAVKLAMQELLNAYTQNQDKIEKSPQLASAIDNMGKKTTDLRWQLRKAVADKVSDCFVGSITPLAAMIAAAKNGDVKKVDQLSQEFADHAKKLVEVALLTCNLSNNEDGIKMVRYAASQIESLYPVVINAAKILAAYPKSNTALENMDTFEESWTNLVQILTEAVDEIAVIDDVLAATENNVLEDINNCLLAVHEGNVDMVKLTAENIKERSIRIHDIAEDEMNNYEPCTYTKRVLEAVKVLNDNVMPKFDKQLTVVIKNMSSNPPLDVDENEFIDTTRLVYDSIREVRRAVLMNRADEDLDPEEVELDKVYVPEPPSSPVSTLPRQEEDVGGITVAREVMSKLPEEDKRKILKQVENFQSEKLTFDREVAKWDDVGNDIVVLAKYMCMIMMQMADFVRQRGPLKSTTDVINAAKKISETGVKLDKLTRQIADQCPESSTKKDLLAYLERVALYSHQINIVSKVKADVQNSNEELIAAGVDSATSLIENAKNLMNAVVLTVKASYVASTKYNRQGIIASPIVVWKMKVPEKKPLVILDKSKQVTVIRKASQRRPQNPIQALSEFHSAGDVV